MRKTDMEMFWGGIFLTLLAIVLTVVFLNWRGETQIIILADVGIVLAAGLVFSYYWAAN